MTFEPQTVRVPAGDMRISLARPDQVPAILTLFDESVTWLDEKGLTGQWGTTPFSQHPRMRERFAEWIEQGALFVAEIADDLVGVLAVGGPPPAYALSYLEGRPGPAYYLEAFTTKRQYQGQGVGGGLLRWAEAYSRERGIAYLRLDCWAENPGLTGYYERSGYTPCGEMLIGSWRGQLFEKALG